jgi:hypothetical protein
MEHGKKVTERLPAIPYLTNTFVTRLVWSIITLEMVKRSLLGKPGKMVVNSDDTRVTGIGNHLCQIPMLIY